MYIFNIIVIAFAIFICVKCDEDYPPKELIEMLKPIHEYCAKENSASEDQLMNYQIMDESANMKCYMACIMDQSNWLSNEGEIKYDFIISNPWLPIKEIMIPNVNKCRNIERSDDKCQQVYNFARCLYEVDAAHWFLP